MNIKKFFENKEQKNIINEDNKKAIVKNNPFSRFVGSNVSARLKKLGKKPAPKAQTQAMTYFDEEHGKLTLDDIKRICTEVFNKYSVDYCYLFGSYAKGKETELSDVDLLVSVPLDGLKFYELVEVLRENLRKKVDLLDVSQLNKNPALLQEVLKDGVKIYG